MTYRRWIGAMALLWSGVAGAAAVSGQGTWETTLQARDFDGNPTTIEGYYDTVLNVTWLNPIATGAPKSYANAASYISSLTVNGIGGWRLPEVRPINGSSFNTNFSPAGATDYGYNMGAPGTAYPGSTAGEMAHLFYTTLGNLSQFDTSAAQRQGSAGVDWGLVNTGPFNVIQPSVQGSTSGTYWTQTVFPGLSPSAHFVFNFYNGQQVYQYDTSNRYVWALHDGSVGSAIAPVPLPAAAWLLLSGLAGLGFVGKRRTAA